MNTSDKHPGRRQPPDTVGHRAHRRVDDRRPGKVIRKRRTEAPCSQCAHSRCPAHKYSASSSNAVSARTSRNDSPACTTSTTSNGQAPNTRRPQPRRLTPAPAARARRHPLGRSQRRHPRASGSRSSHPRARGSRSHPRARRSRSRHRRTAGPPPPASPPWPCGPAAPAAAYEETPPNLSLTPPSTGPTHPAARGPPKRHLSHSRSPRPLAEHAPWTIPRTGIPPPKLQFTTTPRRPFAENPNHTDHHLTRTTSPASPAHSLSGL